MKKSNNAKKKYKEQDLANEMLKFCNYLNTYENLKNVRFDFMLIDYILQEDAQNQFTTPPATDAPEQAGTGEAEQE